MAEKFQVRRTCFMFIIQVDIYIAGSYSDHARYGSKMFFIEPNRRSLQNISKWCQTVQRFWKHVQSSKNVLKAPKF